MTETILMIKRSYVGAFAGDKTWQVAPYKCRDQAHAQRTADWLRDATGMDFSYRVISTNAETPSQPKPEQLGPEAA